MLFRSEAARAEAEFKLAANLAPIGSLAQIAGLPTTIFIGRSGRVVFVHTGAYDTPTTLQQDIQRYALGA